MVSEQRAIFGPNDSHIHMEHMEHMEDVKQRYPQIHQQLSSITTGGRPTQPSCTRRNSWVTGTKHWTSHPVADSWCIGEFRGAKKVSESMGYPRYHLNFGRSNRAQEFLVLNVLKGSSEELGLIVGRSRENWPSISPTKKGILVSKNEQQHIKLTSRRVGSGNQLDAGDII